jgi:hypothetical protein
MVSEGGLQPASVGCNPVHLIVYKGRTSNLCCADSVDRRGVEASTFLPGP